MVNVTPHSWQVLVSFLLGRFLDVVRFERFFFVSSVGGGSGCSNLGSVIEIFQ